jgi:hypothetical protein
MFCVISGEWVAFFAYLLFSARLEMVNRDELRE